MSTIFKIPYIITILGTTKVRANSWKEAEEKMLNTMLKDLICNSSEQFIEVDTEELANYQKNYKMEE